MLTVMTENVLLRQKCALEQFSMTSHDFLQQCLIWLIAVMTNACLDMSLKKKKNLRELFQT